MKLYYKNLPIFLTHSQEEELRMLVLNSLEGVSQISRIRQISFEKLNKELAKIKSKKLWETYINIDISGQEAIFNTYKVISCFVRDNENFILTRNDNKSFVDVLIEDYKQDYDQLEEKYFPIGRIFNLSLKSKNKSNIIEQLFLNNETKFNLFSNRVDVSDVVSIKGVYGHSIFIQFSSKTLVLEWNKGGELGGPKFEGSVMVIENYLMKDLKIPFLSYKDYFSGIYFKN